MATRRRNSGSRRCAASMDANSSSSDVGCPAHNHSTVTTVGLITYYYIPVLCSFGSVGNVASIVVFFGTKLCKLSSSFYLGALAVNDSLFLVSLFLTWLELPPRSRILCKSTTYVSYMCCFLSAWLVVAFTVERFVAVRYPLRRQFIFTVARAKTVLCALTFVAVAAYSPFVWMADVVLTQPNSTCYMCDMRLEWTEVANAVNNVDTVVSLVLPFLVIASLNAAISTTVWQVARVRRSMTRVEEDGGCRRQRSSGDSSQTRVTKMLLVVSTVFLCLNLPSYVSRVIAYSQAPEQQQNYTFIAFQHLTMQLFYTNFGINFALYCVSGQNFRRSLVAMCCPRFRRRPESTQVTVVSEYNKRSSGSLGRRRTVTLNGFQGASSWKDAHEMLPLTK